MILNGVVVVGKNIEVPLAITFWGVIGAKQDNLNFELVVFEMEIEICGNFLGLYYFFKMTVSGKFLDSVFAKFWIGKVENVSLFKWFLEISPMFLKFFVFFKGGKT